MEKEKNNISLYVIIVILSIITICLAGYIVYDKLLNDKETPINNNNNESIENNNITNVITNTEAETILKNLYNDAIRHIYNEQTAYCGESTNETISLNGFTYKKSTTFNNLNELENYLKKYMTTNLLLNSNYNKKITIDENTITSYYEKEGNLYCNNWNKGGNILLENYLIDESSFNISNITKNSFDGTIIAVYKDNNSNKTTKKIKTNVIKENDNWLLNAYEEQN